jgi:hypothetical protein
MKRIVAAGLMVAVATVFGAPIAAADPADLVPYCSGDQTPMDSNCRVSPSQVFTHDSDGTSGADPQVEFGTNPGEEPVV